MMFSGLVWVSLKTFLLALVLTPIVRDIFRSYNVVDRPGRRKIHAYPVPRIGGIPIVLAYSWALISFTDYDRLFPDYNSPVWKVLPGLVITFLVGLLDDFVNLRPLVKLGGQISACAVAVLCGIRVETIAESHVPAWLSWPITIFWLLLASNALNLIDGLDGLCGGMGFFAAVTMFAAAALRADYALMHATLPFAGALLGFLLYNFNPATVFLGDSGALTIGFMLGCFGVMWTQNPATVVGAIILPALAILVPLLDVSLAIARRALRGDGIFAADRGHIHHRLLDRGLSRWGAALVLYAAAMLVAVYAFLFTNTALGHWRILMGVLFLGTLSAGVRELRYAEFDVARRLLFNGEFRKVIATRSRVQYLKDALETARTEEDWWQALANIGQDAGWTQIQWVDGLTTRHTKVFSDQPYTWSFRIPLKDFGEIVVEGGGSEARAPIDLVELAEALERSHSLQRHAWEQRAFS